MSFLSSSLAQTSSNSFQCVQMLFWSYSTEDETPQTREVTDENLHHVLKKKRMTCGKKWESTAEKFNFRDIEK